MFNESQNEPTPSDELLAQYLGGIASSQDIAAVQAWEAANPAHAEQLNLLRTAWRVAPQPSPHGNLDAFVARWRRAVDAESQIGTNVANGQASHRESPVADRTSVARHSASPSFGRPIVREATFWRRMSAVLAAVVVVGAAWYWSSTWRGQSAIGGNEQLYATQAGQRATVTLRDGSRVILAPFSTLRVAPGFDMTARTVTLHGEALFDVARTTGSPFVVHTVDATTRVLGTRFDVRRYPDDRGARISVLTGKVHVTTIAAGHASVTLAAGMTGKIDDSVATVVDGGNVAEAAQWASGQLVFRDAPASEILAALTRWYGYQFRLTDTALAHKHLTLGLSTESSTDALATVKQVLDVELSFDAHTVTLRPRRASVTLPSGRSRREPISPIHTEVGR